MIFNFYTAQQIYASSELFCVEAYPVSIWLNYFSRQEVIDDLKKHKFMQGFDYAFRPSKDYSNDDCCLTADCFLALTKLHNTEKAQRIALFLTEAKHSFMITQAINCKIRDAYVFSLSRRYPHAVYALAFDRAVELGHSENIVDFGLTEFLGRYLPLPKLEVNMSDKPYLVDDVLDTAINIYFSLKRQCKITS
jgi:hypothetical protein